MKLLNITEFGSPVLREVARRLSAEEIKSRKVQQLIKDMKFTLKEQKLGVGLAAPQVGESLAISVIVIQPTKYRPEVEPFELTIINPRIIQTLGYRTQMWEGCISAGKGGLFAKTPRYKKVEVEYLDESGKKYRQLFEGLKSQIMQHEIGHLNGELFMDHVKSTITYMTMKEYKKMVHNKNKK